MSRDDIQKLLGGYATGTLTPEEQQVLFEAALDDQELFDALAREQALRDLMRDPAAKAHLLAALDERPLRWYERLSRGWRPLAAVAAMAGVGAIAVVAWRQSGRSTQPVLVAQVSPPPAANPVSTPAAEPAPLRPPVENQTPPPQTAAKQALPAPPATVAGDSNAPVDRLAKDGPATNPVSPQGAPEEDRRARAKHVAEAPKRKELAGSDTDSPPAVKREAAPAAPPPPLPRPTLASGFRDGKTIGGMNSAPQLQPAAEPKAPLLGSASGNAAGAAAGRVAGGAPGGMAPGGARGGAGGVAASGAIAGAVGGISGGVPRSAPTPPLTTTPPKTEPQPSQSAQVQASPPPAPPDQAKPSSPLPSQSAPSQPQQGQQGAQTQAPSFQSVQAQQQAAARSQFGQARLAPPQGVASETVQVQASASSLDAVSTSDVRSLFYGSSSAASLSTPSAPGGAAGGGGGLSSADVRKKVAAQAEKASAGRQSATVNAIAVNTRTGQARLPNLGVRYRLLRQTATGGFEYVDPDRVNTGDTLELQLMPNDSGDLLVTGRGSDAGWRELMSQRVGAWQTYTTPPLKSGEELQVTLSRRSVSPPALALRNLKSGPPSTEVESAAAAARDVTPLQESKGYFRQSTTEPATYVVANPASTQLFFTVSLSYK